MSGASCPGAGGVVVVVTVPWKGTRLVEVLTELEEITAKGSKRIRIR
jgi:hypothetical protein